MAETDTKIQGLAIASLSLAILAYMSAWLIIGLLFAIPSVICGHLALARAKGVQGAAAGKPLAIIGLVVGYISIVLSILVAAALALALFLTYQHSQEAVELARREAKITAINVSYLTHDQKMWIWATCALLTESNGKRHDVFGGAVPTPEEIAQEKQLLREWWDVYDRESMLSTLDWLWQGGHRDDFEKLSLRVQSLDPGKLQAMKDMAKDNPELLHRITVVEKYYKDVGPKGICGWDYSRYVALCGWGYLAGYLSEKEAWQHALPAALILQARFDSWDDLGKNYLIGREFWSLEDTRKTGARFRRSYIRLTIDPTSPWREYPWNLDLENRKITKSNQIKSTANNPRKPEGLDDLSHNYYDKDNFDRSISDCTKAIEINPKDAVAYINRGIAYKKEGDYDKAISDYNRALEIDPMYAAAYSNLGSIYCDKKKEYDRAVSYFSKAIEINPGFAAAYYNRGNAYKNKNNNDLAISNYNLAIQINPKYANAYYNRAHSYYNKHEYEKAREDVNKAESLGQVADLEFLEDLKKASGRDD